MTGLAAMLGIAAVLIFIYYMYVAYWLITFLIALICAKLFRKVDGMSSVFFGVFVFFIVFSALNIPPLIEPVATYKRYMQLCELDSGLVVHKKVAIESKFWGDDGRPLFTNKRFSALDFSTIPELNERFRYEDKWFDRKVLNRPSESITTAEYSVIEIGMGKLYVNKFHRFTGKFSGISVIYNNILESRRCPEETVGIERLVNSIFIRRNK